MKNYFRKNKRLFTLVFPIFIELFFVNLLTFLDTFMISKHAQDSVAAIGNAGTVIGIFAVLLNVASVGVNVITSQYLGAQDKENANKTLNSGVIFNLSLAFILFFIVEIFGTELLSLIKVDDRYLLEASAYLKIVALGLPFMGITNVLGSYLRAYKKPQILMVSSILANVLNVILNYFLIFGISGLFMGLGSKGAAIATLCSHIFNFSLASIFVKKVLKSKIFSLKLSKHNLALVLKIGLPSALESFCYTIANLIVISAVNTLDQSFMGIAAGRNYLNMILNLIFQLEVAFGAANQILVGHAVGEGNYRDAKKGTFTAFFYCLPIIEICICFLVIFGKPIFNVFSPSNLADLPKFEVALEAILKTLPIIFFFEFGRTLNQVFINALKSAGDVIYPLVIGIFSMFFFMALGSYVFGIWLNLGLMGIYLALALDESFRGILMFIRFLGNKWQSKAINKN